LDKLAGDTMTTGALRFTIDRPHGLTQPTVSQLNVHSKFRQMVMEKL